ncbi:UDP-2,4-diacetamido-2,4,6-trideoxy-beta-L-altropyranose hydrolase [Pseudomonas sp. TTU2014-080ASC]|uniref:UDP-2,4-diacetamido-2,4, 6-trideoxy-beta-L-altropyranose hydrolase n=1 Tax=Pseudomonas sp. TTU2014-080ASC TaxID=1729724 RepID=UPI0007183DA0|nr:UDP-2,4-diacetamido-2,4,6-trideoxy-beta-L-altropyranose hydrolase [Pseudomonas sp. TTU2014-080ASC]KRW62919.1 UDP-2,4-diacetamido-2,4,6-trideoxy-beta-L-altropyranose hydrolase [Pseudomonas sp. TTU2014-080ASC]
MKKVAFRADASLQIGSGHVMRCLTLAQALAEKGFECHFICREHPGNLLDLIAENGFKVHALPVGNVDDLCLGVATTNVVAHASWLGSSQAEDAAQTSLVIQDMKLDWLIVDHYSLDATWEDLLKPFYNRLMVIDDLADREHSCDLLLDQNLGREAQDYDKLVRKPCRFLIGPQYALLRPEFSELREYSLKRRAAGELNHILVTMGGVDQSNATARILHELRTAELAEGTKISVVLGASAPWKDDVRVQARSMPWETEVFVGVNNMAQIMSDADLSIGAAGSTSWERCCLGVPTLLIVLAENQLAGARALAAANAAELVGTLDNIKDISTSLSKFLSPHRMLSMTRESIRITEGTGVFLIADFLVEGDKHG